MSVRITPEELKTIAPDVYEREFGKQEAHQKPHSTKQDASKPTAPVRQNTTKKTTRRRRSKRISRRKVYAALTAALFLLGFAIAICIIIKA